MKRIVIGAALALAFACPNVASAQSTPGLYQGQIPSAGQWNSYFGAKQDVLALGTGVQSAMANPVNASGGLALYGSSGGSAPFSLVTEDTPITATTGGASVAITSNSSFQYFNVGAFPALCDFGTSLGVSPAYLTSGGQWSGATPSAATHVFCEGVGGTTTVNLQEGTGLGVNVAVGSGGGGGGGNVTVISPLGHGTADTAAVAVVPSATASFPVTGTFWQATQPVSGTFWQTTQPVSAASLPLPSGAATSALQTTGNTALGTINTTLGTPFQAGGSIGNTGFGITGTLPAFTATPTFNLGTLNGAATAALQTTGNTALTTINTTLGTPMQTTGGSVTANAGTNLNTSALATSANQTNASQKTQIVDGSGNVIGSTTGNLDVQCANCSGSGVSTADGATWTAGTSLFAGVGGVYQTSPTSNPLTTGHQGFAQLTVNRALMTDWFNVSGTEMGTSGSPVQVSLANTAANATAVKTSVASGGIASGALASGAVVDLTNIEGVIGNATAPTKMAVAGGVYNSSPLTLTNGQSSALQLNSSGQALVSCSNCSGSGAIATDEASLAYGASNSFAPVGGQYSTSITPLTTGQGGFVALTANRSMHVLDDNSAALLAAAQAGTGTFGSATPTSGVAIGGTDGTDLRELLTSSTGQLHAIIDSGGGGAVTMASGAVASGAYASGSIASGALASGAVVDLTNIEGIIGNATAPTKMAVGGGVYNSTPLTLTNGQSSADQLDANGYLNVHIQAGAGSGGTASTIGATYPTTATAAGAEALSTTPSYTTGQMNPLTETLAGNLNVNLATCASGVCNTNGSATSANSSPVVIASDQGAVAVKAASGAFASGALASGSIASGAAVSGAFVAGSIADLAHGQGTMAASVPVAIASNQSTLPVNTAQVNGVTTLTGTGAVGTGAQRVAIGTDTATIAGSAPTTVLLTSPTPYPAGAVPITASATGTTAATTATLTNVTGHTTYICGYSIRANATAATTVLDTVTGVITATMSSELWVAPAASGLGVDEQVFQPCIPASAVSTSIAVVSGAPGTGGLVSVKAWGFSI